MKVAAKGTGRRAHPRAALVWGWGCGFFELGGRAVGVRGAIEPQAWRLCRAVGKQGLRFAPPRTVLLRQARCRDHGRESPLHARTMPTLRSPPTGMWHDTRLQWPSVRALNTRRNSCCHGDGRTSIRRCSKACGDSADLFEKIEQIGDQRTGGTLGANSVNGVINVTTRPASESRAARPASGAAVTATRMSGALRRKFGADGFWRITASGTAVPNDARRYTLTANQEDAAAGERLESQNGLRSRATPIATESAGRAEAPRVGTNGWRDGPAHGEAGWRLQNYDPAARGALLVRDEMGSSRPGSRHWSPRKPPPDLGAGVAGRATTPASRWCAHPAQKRAMGHGRAGRIT